MTLLLFFLLLFWLVIVWQKTGYYLWLWQTKEYRVDRMLAQLFEPAGYKLIFTRDFYIKGLALIGIILISSPQEIIPIALLLYGLHALYILSLFFRKRIKFPQTSIKAVLLFSLSLTIQAVPPLYTAHFFNAAQTASLLMIIDIFIPVILTCLVIAFKPITYCAKQIIAVLAKKKRAQFKNLIAIGITGSFGKTSTKEFLAHILASKFKTAYTKDHQNTEIGAARAILAMRQDTQILVAEMAAYRRGDIKEISEVVKPTMGIITAIGSQHLALFGTMEAILDTKFELAKVLPKKGVLIVNWDNEYIRFKVQGSRFKVVIKNSKLNIVRYSLEDERAQVYADTIKESLENIEFTVHYRNERENFQVNLLGKHNVSNILAASAAALTLGVTLKEISEAVSKIQQIPHTMHLHWLPGNIPLIDDSYNASVDGVKAAFAYLKNWQDKKRILVMPSLIELGDKAFILHEELGQEIARVCEAAFITDIKYKEPLWRGWKSAREDANNLHFHVDPQRLIEEVGQVIDEKSVILIEGRVPKEVTDFLLHHQ
ncbi:MAG: UDP-N-acetylmuramoyl-tripeptide--D-alanyl-D-alanine ligase [Candidatus Portnoybacteria bacterium]|nr:UDP-N-acetylmuramoyl-tripeptide--D-alanyl-D-alanine ligase [Candidatus Portnoybacteria bacterium]